MKYYINLIVGVGFLLIINCIYAQHSTPNILTVTFEEKTEIPETVPRSHQVIVPRRVMNYSFLNGVPTEYDVSAVSSVRLFGYNPFYLFVGLDRTNNEKVIIVDTNNNHDFSDDEIFRFSLSDFELSFPKELMPRLAIVITRGTCHQRQVPLLLRPFAEFPKEHFSTEDEFDLSVSFLTNFFVQGVTEINNQKVIINATHHYANAPLPFVQNTVFKFSLQKDDSARSFMSRVGSIFLLLDRKIEITGAVGNQLFLKDHSNFPEGSVGRELPIVYAYSLLDNQKIRLNEKMNDKYVFINFWGSWCVPCIRTIPKFKDFYEKVKGREDVLVLGVAVEMNESGAERVKELIDEHKIEWPNVWVDLLDRIRIEMIHRRLNVLPVPEYVIIDRDGVIRYRGLGEQSTQEAISFFLDLIEK